MAAPRRSRSRWTIGVATLCCAFAARLAFVAIFLPPWQNPDEPDHFGVIRALSRQSSLDLTKRRDPAVQAEILASMAEHGWWAAYEEAVPDPLPRTFAEMPAHIGDATNAPSFYYIVASRYLRLVHAETLLGQYYALRVASLLLSLLTLLCILNGAQAWFDDDVALCAGALVILVPQFALISVSISADPLVAACAAFVWWQAGRLWSGAGGLLSIVLMLSAAVLAVLAKRIAVPLIAQASLLVIIASVAARRRRALLVAAGVALLAGAGGLVMLAGKLFARPDEIQYDPITPWGVVIAMAKRYWATIGWSGNLSPKYFAVFTWRLFESAYLVAGWMRFHAPAVLIALAFIIMMATLVRGLAVSLRAADPQFRNAAAMTALFVVVQLAAIYGTEYYRIGAQGRFLFPAIGPFAALCAIGLVRWRNPQTRAVVCSTAIGMLAVLDLLSWVTTVIPAYAY